MLLELVDQHVDFLLGAHVDTAGGLVQNQHVRLRHQRLGQHHLLLVAAGEVAHLLVLRRRLDVDLLDIIRADFLLPAHVYLSELRNLVQGRERDVLAHVHDEHQAVALAVLGHVIDAVSDGLVGIGGVNPLAAQRDFALLPLVQAIDGLRQLRAACADESGHAQHFAAAHIKGDIPHQMVAQALHREDDVAQLHVHIGELLVQAAADHHADQARLIQLADGLLRDELAVAQDRRVLADFEDLLQSMGDVDDALLLFLERADDVEQALHLFVRQRVCGLVHDDDLCVHQQGLRDLHHLLLRNGQRADERVRTDVHPHFLQKLRRFLDHVLLVQRTAALAHLAAQEDVFINLHLWNQVQLLVDDGDAVVLGLARVRIGDLAALVEDRALIPLVHAGEHLHQRRFACSVFAQQSHRFALVHLQADSVERKHAWEALHDVAHFQYYPAHSHLQIPPPGPISRTTSPSFPLPPRADPERAIPTKWRSVCGASTSRAAFSVNAEHILITFDYSTIFPSTQEIKYILLTINPANSP